MNRRATILIPTRNRAGHLCPLVFERAASKLCTAFGGLTSLPPCKGWWIAPGGGCLTDEVVPTIVNYEAGSHRDETVTDIAKMIAFEADQICVFVEFANVEAILVSNAKVEVEVPLAA